MNRALISKIFENPTDTDTALSQLMKLLGEGLRCERCLLFLREPHSAKTRMTHQWVLSDEHAIKRDERGWVVESPTLPDVDPMYREALTNPAALFIDDIETADPVLVNAAFEREHFGHRALIHVPIHHHGLMYGIIEPCVFSEPRLWSDADRALVAFAQEQCLPATLEYVSQHCR